MDVRLQLARTFLGAGDTKQAVSELERIIAASPDSPGASALLVVSLASDGRLDEADKAAHAFRERTPRVAYRFICWHRSPSPAMIWQGPTKILRKP